jgi:hypothetical protein
MKYTNSPLVSHVNLSPNHSGPRIYPLTRITIHCTAGRASVEGLGTIFADPARQASSQYGIGEDGRIGLYVEEKNRCWCSSSYDNDERAICIEVSSEAYEHFAVNEVAFASLIDLCVDICQRYGKKRLLWLGDKDTTLMYKPKEDEFVISCHRWFADKSCPGDWLFERLGEIAKEVTTRLNPTEEKEPSPSAGDGNTPHDWAREVFDWAVENGILRGSSAEKVAYRLNDPVTREEALVFLHRTIRPKDKA